MSLINDRGEIDERELERIRLLFLSAATKEEFEEVFLATLNGLFECLIELAKRRHASGDNERLGRACKVLLIKGD